MSRPPIAVWASAALAAALALEPAAAVEAVAGTQLVMHVGPGAHYRPAGDIPAETRLTVHGCSAAQGWCLVRFGGRHGWIEGESLNVVGFSRPPRPVAAFIAPAAPEAAPVPVVPGAPLPPFIVADDVIVGMGEQFGFAAVAPGTIKPFGFRKGHHAGLGFQHDAFKPDFFVRHGRHQAHLGKSHRSGRVHFGKDVHVSRGHFGKDFHVSRGHFGKRGHFAIHGKRPDRGWQIARFHSRHHVSRGHFGKEGRFFIHGKSPDRGWHIARGHSRHHFGKGGASFGHAGAVSFGGLRIKGGWRP